LVMPNDISGTYDAMKFITKKLSHNVYISLMSQYHPVYRANNYKEINRKIINEEYNSALEVMSKFKLNNGWCQNKPFKEDRDIYLGENF